MKLNYLFFIRLAVLYVCVLALTGPTAYAGKCKEDKEKPGTWTCSGPDSTNDKGLKVIGSKVHLIVNTLPGFGINVTSKDDVDEWDINDTLLNPQDTDQYAIDLRTIIDKNKALNLNFTDNNKSSITGAFGGISLRNYTLGFTKLTTTGSVTGRRGHGIQVESSINNSKPITIDAKGDVSGKIYGIVGKGKDVKITTRGKVSGGMTGIIGEGGGDVKIDAREQVTGDRGSGIYAKGKKVTIHAKKKVSVYGRGHGIYGNGKYTEIIAHGDVSSYIGTGIVGEGDGVVKIYTVGNVSSNIGNGIVGEGNDVMIDAYKQVTGGDYGIYGRGDKVKIHTQGEVSGDKVTGIYAKGRDVTISTTGEVSSNIGTGIYAKGKDVTITTRGEVSGGKYGIYGFGNDVKIDAGGQVTAGGDYGIYGNGDKVKIYTQGEVSGGNYGISGLGKNIEIVAKGKVSGGYSGIYGKGEDDVKITTHGDVSGGVDYGIHGTGNKVKIDAHGNVSADRGTGIYGKGYDVTIIAQKKVSSGKYGIYGDGDKVKIDAFGNVSGGEYGIYGKGGNVTIIAKKKVTASGVKYGIYGSGDKVKIYAHGDVSGKRHGIYGSGDKVKIDAHGNVSGKRHGIYGKGEDDVKITTHGDVSGGADYGIYGEGENVTIIAKKKVTASGGKYGIYGSGNKVKIDAHGDISSGEYGIYGKGENVTIIAKKKVTASGGKYGIYGSGDKVKIYAHGDVSSDWATAIQINSRSSSKVTTTGTVTGETYGIAADATASANITVNGPVIGQTGAAIYTRATTSNITLNRGAAVGLRSGKAIEDGGGKSTIVVNEGRVLGEVSLGYGNDLFTVDGGDISAVTLLDGGEDTLDDKFIDVLTFKNVPIKMAGGKIKNWEKVIVGEGATFTWTGHPLAVGKGSAGTGLFNRGTLSLQNDKAGETLKLTGNYIGEGGVLAMDVDFAKLRFDSLEISGSVKGKSIIKVNDITDTTRGKSSREGEMLIVRALKDHYRSDEDFLIFSKQRYNSDPHKGRFNGSIYAWNLGKGEKGWSLTSGDVLDNHPLVTKRDQSFITTAPPVVNEDKTTVTPVGPAPSGNLEKLILKTVANVGSYFKKSFEDVNADTTLVVNAGDAVEKLILKTVANVASHSKKAIKAFSSFDTVNNDEDKSTVTLGPTVGNLFLEMGAVVASHSDKAIKGFSDFVVNAGPKVTKDMSLVDETGDSTIVVNAGDKVIGEVSLGDGTDIYTVNGGDISGVTLLDGGDDTGLADEFIDVLTFKNVPIKMAGGKIKNWEKVVVDKGATLTLTDHQLTAGDGSADTGLFNKGTLSLQNNKAGETLKLSGNYTGKGGALAVDVDFDKVSSDFLEVSGSVKGKTIIKVNDITSGKSSATGEMVVVKAPNDSNKKDEDFSIDPDQRYNNDSHKGRFKGSYYAWKLETKGNNWILASGDILVKPKTSVKQDPPVGSMTPVKPKTLVKQDPPVGSMAPVKPKRFPAILAEIPAYTTLPTIGREITFNELDVLQARMSKLHTRMGELRNNTSDRVITGTVSPDQVSWSAWTKGTINQLKLGTGSSFDADGTYGGVAIGFDKRFTLANNWHLFGGIFAGRNSGDFNTSGKGNRYTSHESADLDVVTRSVGVYGSFLDGNGTYMDTVAQYFVLDADINAAGLKALVEGNAVAASIEAGHGFDLADGWLLEPQAQLRLSRVTWDNFNDGTNDVSFDDHTYVTGGIGARFTKSFSVGVGEVKPWLYAGINHEFTDAPGITYAKHSFGAHGYATTIATRLGVTADLSRSMQLYGDVGYSADLDDYNAVRGDLGLRFTW